MSHVNSLTVTRVSSLSGGNNATISELAQQCIFDEIMSRIMIV